MVELAARQQNVLAAECADDLLAHPPALTDALTDALDGVQIPVTPRRLLANEHADVVRAATRKIKKTPILVNMFHYTIARPKHRSGKNQGLKPRRSQYAHTVLSKFGLTTAVRELKSENVASPVDSLATQIAVVDRTG